MKTILGFNCQLHHNGSKHHEDETDSRICSLWIKELFILLRLRVLQVFPPTGLSFISSSFSSSLR